VSEWSVAEAALKWGVSERRVIALITNGRVVARKQGRRWLIPVGTPKPADERKYRYLDIDESLIGVLASVDAMKTELARRRPLTAGELDQIRHEFAVEYTYDSNAIEGSTLTLRETALILEGLTIGEKPLKEHLEAIGHRDAYDYVERLAAATPREPLTERIIKEIHFLVLPDRPLDRGNFRSVPVRILGTSHHPPEPYLVREKVETLLASVLIDRHHPIERAARFHLEFESIHPFIDGNGRTGRLLLNLMLLQDGYLPINIKYADRRRYYDCFQTWDDHHDPLPMITLVAQYAKDRLETWLSTMDQIPSPDGLLLPTASRESSAAHTHRLVDQLTSVSQGRGALVQPAHHAGQFG